MVYCSVVGVYVQTNGLC